MSLRITLPAVLALFACGGSSDSGGTTAHTTSTSTTGTTGTTNTVTTNTMPTYNCEEGGLGDIDPTCCEQWPDVTFGYGELALDGVYQNGDQAVMVRGPQGGWHILGAFQACNFRTVVSHEWRTVHKATGTVLGENVDSSDPKAQPPLVLMVADDTCCGHYANVTLILDSTSLGASPPEVLCNEEIVMTWEVLDEDGRRVTEEVTVIGRGDCVDKDICPPPDGVVCE